MVWQRFWKSRKSCVEALKILEDLAGIYPKQDILARKTDRFVSGLKRKRKLFSGLSVVQQVNCERFYMMKIGVIGAGSWGTTLANLLAKKGHHVTLWVYEADLVRTPAGNRVSTIFIWMA